MSGIIVPRGPSVQPVFTGYAPVRLRSYPAINPRQRMAAATAPAMHAPRGALLPSVAAGSSMSQETATVPPRRRRLVIAYVSAAIIGFLLLAVQLGLSAAYAGRFLPGVSVAGKQLGGLTLPQAQVALAASASSARVRFNAGSTPYILAPSAVGASFDAPTTLDQAYTIGHPSGFSFMPQAIWQSLASPANLGMSYDVNQPALQALVQKIVDASGQKPVDARIVITNGVPAIQPASSGHTLATTAVTAAVTTQLALPGSAPPLLHPSAQAARIQASDLGLALTQTKQLLDTPITITYQGKSFQPTATQIGSWIIYNKSPPSQPPALTPKLDPDAMSIYLTAIAKQINVSPVTQEVNVQNGTASVYQPGQNGITLDAATLATKLAGLTPGQPLTVVAPTTPVPFPTNYNNSVALPYDQYIEVNLTTQHLWVYQNHSVIFDSPVTSGATSAGFPTATGMFSILAKQTDRHLVGYQYGPAYNYDVFVQYWMQFYEGFGLHDASWRSSFGGPDYYYDGSHGCVNLPLATAAWLYNWSSVGTPVWVHT
jgi:lipoprotein-anchoring transpeptidase ErfK/SrfK